MFWFGHERKLKELINGKRFYNKTRNKKMLNVLSLFSGIGAIFRQFNFEKVA